MLPQLRYDHSRMASLKTSTALALAALAAPLSDPAAADETSRIPWFREAISLDLAVIPAYIDSDVTVSGNSLDLESDLGLDDFSALPSAELVWRFSRNRRHRLEAGYFSVLRSGDRRSDFDLTLPNDIVIPLGSRIETDLNLQVVALTYGYDLLNDENVELGLFLGLDFISLNTDVKGTLTGPGFSVSDSVTRTSFDVPFPTAGAYLNWAFLDSLALRTRFQYFGLKLNKASGELFRGSVRLEHRTFEHLHLYAGVEALGASVELAAKNFQEFSLVYAGPRVGVVLRF